MILDHYGFLIKLQKMKRSITGKSSSKNAKVSYVQVTIAASLLEHQGIPEEIIGRRTKKGKPENEIKWVRWTAAHNTWEPITNLAGYEGMVAAFEKVSQENYDKKSSEELIRKAVIKSPRPHQPYNLLGHEHQMIL